MIYQLTELARQKQASDVLLSAGSPPLLRIGGALEACAAEPLTAAATEQLAGQLLDARSRLAYQKCGEADCAWEDALGRRYRVNVFRQCGTTALVLRLISGVVTGCAALGLPTAAEALASRRSGLILIGGTAGSGKSTTMAALLDKINAERRAHIITLEDPVEFRHTPKQSIFSQRTVGEDTQSFASGLRSALREDPDVIAVGELRDSETAEAALAAAETGHLVLATLHTPRAAAAVNRIADLFPGRREQVGGQLAEVLQGVICQELLPLRSGKGRVAAFEVLLATPAVRQLIREGHSHQIASYIQTGRQYGMLSMEESKRILLRQGRIAASELEGPM